MTIVIEEILHPNVDSIINAFHYLKVDHVLWNRKVKNESDVANLDPNLVLHFMPINKIDCKTIDLQNYDLTDPTIYHPAEKISQFECDILCLMPGIGIDFTPLLSRYLEETGKIVRVFGIQPINHYKYCGIVQNKHISSLICSAKKIVVFSRSQLLNVLLTGHKCIESPNVKISDIDEMYKEAQDKNGITFVQKVINGKI